MERKRKKKRKTDVSSQRINKEQYKSGLRTVKFIVAQIKKDTEGTLFMFRRRKKRNRKKGSENNAKRKKNEKERLE